MAYNNNNIYYNNIPTIWVCVWVCVTLSRIYLVDGWTSLTPDDWVGGVCVVNIYFKLHDHRPQFSALVCSPNNRQRLFRHRHYHNKYAIRWRQRYKTVFRNVIGLCGVCVCLCLCLYVKDKWENASGPQWFGIRRWWGTREILPGNKNILRAAMEVRLYIIRLRRI